MKALIVTDARLNELDGVLVDYTNSLRAAMISVDIPSGCTLAVVDLEGTPVGEMLKIKPGNIDGISLSASHYRKVVQEVKLW